MNMNDVNRDAYNQNVGRTVVRADGVKGTVMDASTVPSRRGGGVSLLVSWFDSTTSTVVER